jgi:hypothetical protein
MKPLLSVLLLGMLSIGRDNSLQNQVTSTPPGWHISVEKGNDLTVSVCVPRDQLREIIVDVFAQDDATKLKLAKAFSKSGDITLVLSSKREMR